MYENRWIRSPSKSSDGRGGISGSSSVGRAEAFQASGRESKSRLPLKKKSNMDQKELDRNRKIFASTNNLNFEDVNPIPKSELEVGRFYYGECRNSDFAMWDGEKFWYSRYKFGSTYMEGIRHYEDDDGYDVFVPFKASKWTEVSFDLTKETGFYETEGPVTK